MTTQTIQLTKEEIRTLISSHEYMAIAHREHGQYVKAAKHTQRAEELRKLLT